MGEHTYIHNCQHKIMKFIFATLFICAVLHLKTALSRPEPGKKLDDGVVEDDPLKNRHFPGMMPGGIPGMGQGGMQPCPPGTYRAPNGQCCPDPNGGGQMAMEWVDGGGENNLCFVTYDSICQY